MTHSDQTDDELGPSPSPIDRQPTPSTIPHLASDTQQLPNAGSSDSSGSSTSNSTLAPAQSEDSKCNKPHDEVDDDRTDVYEELEERIRTLEATILEMRSDPIAPRRPRFDLLSLLSGAVEYEQEDSDHEKDSDAEDEKDEPDVREADDEASSVCTGHQHRLNNGDDLPAPVTATQKRKVSNNSVLSDHSVSNIYDADHPTAQAAAHAHSVDDATLNKFVIEREELDKMTHKQRVKAFEGRLRMNFSQPGMRLKHRERLLLKLGRALVYFGAPNHRVEQLLSSIAAHYNIPCQFVLFPSMLVFSIERDDETSEVHFLRVKGSIQLTYLHSLHQIYRLLSHGDMTAQTGCKRIQALLRRPAVYGRKMQLLLATLSSMLVCVVGFEGSLLDSLIAASFGAVLFFARSLMNRSEVFANLYEIIMAMLVSFIARALSTIHSSRAQFCYTSIMSASIVSFLPGFLALSASLELTTRNMICGSVKVVYGLVYVLLLSFSLTLGSKLWLAFDSTDGNALTYASDADASVNWIYGVFLSDNATAALNGTETAMNATDLNAIVTNATQLLLDGLWTFTTTYTNGGAKTDQIAGCYRPNGYPWYMRSVSFGLNVALVPLFALVVALSSGQACWPVLLVRRIKDKKEKAGEPTRTKTVLHPHIRELLVMILIAFCGFLTTFTSNLFWSSHSDIVTAYGAFIIGLFGNSYSRVFRGTAFTAMVPGVLLLVPSGLSAVGGVTGTSAFDIGVKMLAVVVGITTGLFMSTAVVYLVGNRKKGAIMSF